MNNWFSFTDNEKYEVIRYTADKMGFSDVVIEKDWWVCMVLRAVFQSKYRELIVHHSVRLITLLSDFQKM